MRLIDADDLQTRFAYKFHLLTSSTVLLDEDDVCETIDNTPTVMQIEWNKPSEELPKVGTFVLYVPNGYRNVISGRYEDGDFVSYDGLDAYKDGEVSAWCYAPSLPEWCEEE